MRSVALEGLFHGFAHPLGKSSNGGSYYRRSLLFQESFLGSHLPPGHRRGTGSRFIQFHVRVRPVAASPQHIKGGVPDNDRHPMME
jgi:hypothetical protein